MIDQDILYSECPCGSGKKFKFCCYPSIRDDLPRDPTRADVTDAIRMRSRATRLAELTAKSGVLDLDRFHELIGRGLRHLHSGRYREAESVLLQAKDEFGMLPTPYNNLALCVLVQGNLKEAEKWVQEDAYLSWLRVEMRYYDMIGDAIRLRNVKRSMDLVSKQFKRGNA